MPAQQFVEAIINVTDINFVPATGNALSLCTAKFNLDPVHGVLHVNSEFRVSQRAKLVFFFPEPYFPLEIWFIQTGLTDDPGGHLNLRDRHADDRQIEVKDHLLRGFRGARWKMLIPIFNDDVGAIGLLDPEITNTNEFFTPSN